MLEMEKTPRQDHLWSFVPSVGVTARHRSCSWAPVTYFIICRLLLRCVHFSWRCPGTEIALPVPTRYQYFYHVAFQAGNAFAETVIFHREITVICASCLNSGINFRGSEALACVKSRFWRCGRQSLQSSGSRPFVLVRKRFRNSSCASP